MSKTALNCKRKNKLFKYKYVASSFVSLGLTLLLGLREYYGACVINRLCAKRNTKASKFLNSIFILILLATFTVDFVYTVHAEEIDYVAARQRMVQKQLVARGIKDKGVLDVMSCVERHRFVPKNMERYAYKDTPLPIGEGQTISQPYIVALMTEVLQLKGDEKVLEVGTGSGYQAAILAELAKEVYTIEIIESLGNEARERLRELGYRNIKVKIADGYYGWKEYAPFDAIIVTAAPEYIPQPLIDQLKVGGRLVIPVGEEWMQKLLLVQKQPGGKLKKYEITGVLFVPLVGDHPKVEPKEESEEKKRH